jgi:hypothetical protein
MLSLLVSETQESNTPARVTTLVKTLSLNLRDDTASLYVQAVTRHSLLKSVLLAANEPFSHSPQRS